MNQVIKEKRRVWTRILALVITLGIIAVAAWGLKLSLLWAAKNQEDKVVSDGQTQRSAVPEGAAGQVGSAEAEHLLAYAKIRVFNRGDSTPEEFEYMNTSPTKNELSEGQAAVLAVNEVQRIFGADLNNTILLTRYADCITETYAFMKELPEYVREKLIKDYQDWIVPPRWYVTAIIVNGDHYKDCRTSLEFIDKLHQDTANVFEENSFNDTADIQDDQRKPTEFRCAINTITGEVISIERESHAELSKMSEARERTDEQAAEPLYRGFLHQCLPDLSIVSVELVDNGFYEEGGRKIYSKKSKITMSDGSQFLFEDGDLVSVKYYPASTPDYAMQNYIYY